MGTDTLVGLDVDGWRFDVHFRVKNAQDKILPCPVYSLKIFDPWSRLFFHFIMFAIFFIPFHRFVLLCQICLVLLCMLYS